MISRTFLKQQVSNFGSKCNLSEDFFKKRMLKFPASSLIFPVSRTGLIDQVLRYANFKGKINMNRAGGTKKKRITGLAK